MVCFNVFDFFRYIIRLRNEEKKKKKYVYFKKFDTHPPGMEPKPADPKSMQRPSHCVIETLYVSRSCILSVTRNLNGSAPSDPNNKLLIISKWAADVSFG